MSGVSYIDRVNINSQSLVRQWAIAGAGILLKSPIEQRQEMADGRLVRLLAEWQIDSYPLHALLPSGRFVPVRVRALVNFLASKFKIVSDELLRTMSR